MYILSNLLKPPKRICVREYDKSIVLNLLGKPCNPTQMQRTEGIFIWFVFVRLHLYRNKMVETGTCLWHFRLEDTSWKSRKSLQKSTTLRNKYSYPKLSCGYTIFRLLCSVGLCCKAGSQPIKQLFGGDSFFVCSPFLLQKAATAH